MTKQYVPAPKTARTRKYEPANNPKGKRTYASASQTIDLEGGWTKMSIALDSGTIVKWTADYGKIFLIGGPQHG